MNTEIKGSHLVCVLFCWFFAKGSLAICDVGSCSAGQYWNGNLCVNCHTGTYQTEENHKCQSCKSCTEDGPDLVKVKSCSATEDAKFKCRPGTTQYSNNQLSGLECKQCRECPAGYRKVSDCTEDTDTTCESQSQVSPYTDTVRNATQQPTEASVEIQSETTRGPHWTNTSTTFIDNHTWSINITYNNSSIKYQITTSSNTTADGGNQTIVDIIVPLACVLVPLVVGTIITVIVLYVRKCRRRTLPTDADALEMAVMLQDDPKKTGAATHVF